MASHGDAPRQAEFGQDVDAVRPPQKSAKRHKKVNGKAKFAADSNEAVLLADVGSFLARMKPRSFRDTPVNVHVSPERFSTVEVEISSISSFGEGLGLSSISDRVFVVPYTAPGDVVQAKIINCREDDNYIIADLVKVIRPSSQRDDTRIRCQYFSACSGCQFQMLSYEDQLAHKKTIIERAYKNFSKLAPEYIPTIAATIGSPLQYAYRTKLTPHFDRPGGPRREGCSFKEVPPIGFQRKGQRRTLDIESCPIGTPVLNLGMKRERLRVVEQLGTYKKGATILLRESTERISLEEKETITPSLDGNASNQRDNADKVLASSSLPTKSTKDEDVITTNFSDYTEVKSCISNSNATSTEYVNDFKFESPAGAFFQNNNSILPRFTSYIRDHVLPQSATGPVHYLIDAYCGSGLFTVTLSSLFTASIGIDIAPSSITAACNNAASNHIPNATFLAADATALFAQVTFPPSETVVIIDPPRKGCDESFLTQLLHFGPQRVVYVSCNVHTQARDVGILVDGRDEVRYDIESLVGFDFFPQTSHVESVAVLSRVVTDVTARKDEAHRKDTRDESSKSC